MDGALADVAELVTDGASEEAGANVRFLGAATPTPERLTTVLAQAAEDDGLRRGGRQSRLPALVLRLISGPEVNPD